MKFEVLLLKVKPCDNAMRFKWRHNTITVKKISSHEHWSQARGLTPAGTHTPSTEQSDDENDDEDDDEDEDEDEDEQTKLKD